MESAPHLIVLGLAFGIGAIMGAVANKTNFCTMGAVSDWLLMGDSARLRSWLLAMGVAILGVTLLEAMGMRLGNDTFPPYRTPLFAWLRYVLGGLLFGVGMTLGSGCGNKTLVRLGGGNLKSLVVLAVAAAGSYLMLWTGFYAIAFDSWLAPTAVDLASRGVPSQAFGDLAGGSAGGWLSNRTLGVAIGLTLVAFAFASREFRTRFDPVLAGLVIGLAVVAGWAITAGSLGEAWKEYATMTPTPPSRVATQSYTFISPMGDLVRYLSTPTRLENINFGVASLAGVLFGSFAWALATRTLRLEWFRDGGDALNHVIGGALMGIGGVLAMGCTIGQAVTGVSTLAAGSFLVTVSIMAGTAATLRYQLWRNEA
jgi:uncharacterized membrane protein YedE/YeeE